MKYILLVIYFTKNEGGTVISTKIVELLISRNIIFFLYAAFLSIISRPLDATDSFRFVLGWVKNTGFPRLRMLKP